MGFNDHVDAGKRAIEQYKVAGLVGGGAGFIFGLYFLPQILSWASCGPGDFHQEVVRLAPVPVCNATDLEAFNLPFAIAVFAALVFIPVGAFLAAEIDNAISRPPKPRGWRRVPPLARSG